MIGICKRWGRRRFRRTFRFCFFRRCVEREEFVLGIDIEEPGGTTRSADHDARTKAAPQRAIGIGDCCTWIAEVFRPDRVLAAEALSYVLTRGRGISAGQRLFLAQQKPR